jgi:hypothetical protein
MTLTEGYIAASTGVFTVTGNPVPAVTKTAGNAAITWNPATSQLDIAAGLLVGVYPVVLTASNGISTDATFTFTLTVTPPPTYSITIHTSGNGAVTSNKTTAQAGETVSLTVTAGIGYELVSVTVSGVTLSSVSSTSSFTMPAHDVTVTAQFQKTARQLAWEIVKPIIEAAATFTLTQQQTPNEATACYALADLINELLKNDPKFTTFNFQFSINPQDFVIYTFVPANAGTVDNANGVNGRFEFRVTPPDVIPSAYNSGTITASPVSNDSPFEGGRGMLKAWTQNGVLYVSGLTPGAKWSVYNIVGTLIYTGIATSETDNYPSLQERGIYIVVSNGKTVKIVNN